MTDRLQGKRIFLTGAAQGIGLAIAEACLAEGASLILVDMDAGLLEKTVARLDAGDRLAHAVADISDSDAIAAAVQAAKASIGPVNALINNAGINVFSAPLDCTDAEWQRCFDVNLKARGTAAAPSCRGSSNRGAGRFSTSPRPTASPSSPIPSPIRWPNTRCWV